MEQTILEADALLNTQARPAAAGRNDVKNHLAEMIDERYRISICLWSRLDRSPGVHPVPLKTCTCDCIYWQPDEPETRR
jgi:hypothetical protein